MQGIIVARRYAKSLVEICPDEGSLRSVLDEFRVAVGPLSTDEIMEFWKNPSISAGKKTRLVEDISSQLEMDRKLLSFLRVLANKNRISLLKVIFEEFRRLARERLGEVAVEVETPFELSEEEKNDMSSILKRKLGKKVILDMKINKDLLAGAWIKIGDKVIDGSILMRLRKLKEEIAT